MYYVRKNNKVLFLLFDILGLLISYITTFNFNMSSKVSVYLAMILVVICTAIIVMGEEYSTIGERGYLVELKMVFIYTVKLVSLFALYTAIFEREYFYNLSSSLELPKFMVLIFVFTYVFRTAIKRINSKYKDDSRNIIILSEFEDLDKIGKLPPNYNVLGYANDSEEYIYNNKPVIHGLDQIRYFLSTHRVDEIYVNLPSHSNLRETYQMFELLGIPMKINITPIIQEVGANTIVTFQGDNVYLTSAMKIATLRQMIFKRLMDIVLSIIGIILTGIVAILIYPIVRKEAPGPLIFKQTRMGQNGKKFQIYKFRSMYMDAEERKKELMEKNQLSSDLMFKMDNDPRIFPFGQKLRDWSLDELPQFINVLKGDMSVVGTRPPTYDEYKKYELHQFKRMQVKPGITGMWQTSGRSNILDFEEVVKLDLKYIEEWSLRLDIKIIFRTILVVLKREGSK